MAVPSIEELRSNEAAVFKEAVDLLIRISGNILKEPENSKFRTLSLASNVFTTKIMPVLGTFNCLLDMGFQEGTNSLILPKSVPIERVRLVHEELKQCRSKSVDSPVSPIAGPSQKTQSDEKSYESCFQHLRYAFPNSFLQSALEHADAVLKYEEKKLQLKALQCIPLEDLNLCVEKLIRNIQKVHKKDKTSSEEYDYQELFLNSLINWFKEDFFTWVNAPDCTACGSSEPILQGVEKSPDSAVDRIEVYKCKNCNGRVVFPRYNDPETLLTTRKGRCGEWANCFTLLCRALKFDSRVVFDVTDHVWTEVYLPLSKRWVHCDPCEAVIDKPLMYESGWKKKLSYVLAYSCEEVQDVTWRYTSQHKLVLKRRQLCKEADLEDLILKVREIRGKSLTQARRAFVIKRSLLEVTDMLLERQPSEDELKGRTSGSLAWRLNRGEIEDVSDDGLTWTITEKDLVNGVASFGYSASRDVYVRGPNDAVCIKGWRNGVVSAISVHLKIEKDWKMAYLARTVGSATSRVVWRVELDEGLNLGIVALDFQKTTFHSGIVDVTISSDDFTHSMSKDENRISTNGLSGKKWFTVTATLQGGEGNEAWQHTQLFRQSLSDVTFPFKVTMHVNKSPSASN